MEFYVNFYCGFGRDSDNFELIGLIRSIWRFFLIFRSYYCFFINSSRGKECRFVISEKFFREFD